MINKTLFFLIPTLGGGGAENVCISLANEMDARGWVVNLIIVNDNESLRVSDLSPSVNLHSLGASRTRSALLPLMLFLIKNKPKLVVVFNSELTLLMVLAKSLIRSNVKILSRNINTLSIRIQSMEGLWRRRFYIGLIKYLYPKVDHIVNQCQGMKDDLVSLASFRDDQISVIYNPVGVPISSYLENNYNDVERPSNYFICVGRLEHQKAFHYALQAFSKICSEYSDFRLKIIGKGSLEKALRAQAELLNISDKVDFIGYVRNPVHYYIGARATLLTSVYEGFPNVLIESIFLGTPVLSFDCPSGPNEIIVQGKNGYLIDSYDTEAFAKAMISLIKSPPSPDVVMKTSLKFDRDKIFNKYEELFVGFI